MTDRPPSSSGDDPEENADYAPLVAAVAAATGHGPWMFVVASVVINMVIHYVYHRRLESFPLKHLGTLLGAASRIEAAAPATPRSSPAP